MKLQSTVCIFLTATFIALAPVVRAAHATNFLDALQLEITNRIAHAETNTTPAQQKSLSAAARILNRNTATLVEDVKAFASATTRLNARFTNDGVFPLLEHATVEAYSMAAHDQLAAVISLVATSSVPRSLSNRLAKAGRALAHADASTNSVPVHARALVAALNKIRVAGDKVGRIFKAPVSLENQRVTVVEDAIVNDRTSFYLSGDTQTYFSDNPEELGLWSYERTSPTTGLITLRSNFPVGDYAARPMMLVFSNLVSGTFTGTDITGANIRGNFTVEPEP